MRSDDGLLIRVARGRGHGLVAHLSRYHIREDLTIFQTQEELYSVLVSGSEGRTWLDNYFDVSVPVNRYQQIQARDGANHFSTRSTSAQLMPVDWISSDCFLITVPYERKDVLHSSLLAARLQNSPDEMITYLRLQQGWPSVNDIPEKTLPQEVGLNDRAISLTKGCYLGQETVARIDALGQVQKLFRRLQIHTEDAIPSPGTNIEHEEKSVGRITSAIRSPVDARVFALGFVRRPQANAGAQLYCCCGDVEVIE